MDEEIRVTLTAEDIARKTDSEKLTILLSIAMSNYNCLRKHSEILFGNGKEGICDTIRTHRRALNWLWGMFFTAAGGFLAILITHLSAGAK